MRKKIKQSAKSLYKGRYFLAFYDKSDEELLYIFNNIEEILRYKKEEITAQDVNYITEIIKPYRLWEQNSYKEYLDRISQNIIQYDDINNEVITFWKFLMFILTF